MNEWHKSSHSAGGGNCVEVREGLVTGIRDTQNRGHGHLDFTPDAWTALVSAVRGQ